MATDNVQETTALATTTPQLADSKTETVKNTDGSSRVVVRDERGCFVKVPKEEEIIPVPNSRFFTKMGREWLIVEVNPETGEPETDGRKTSVPRYIFLLNKGQEMILNETDGKRVAAAAKMIEVLLKFNIPAIAKTDDEIEAAKKSGNTFNTVVVDPLAGLSAAERVEVLKAATEYKPVEIKRRPSFADAEVISTDPPAE